MAPDTARLFFTGPFVLLIFVAALSITAIVAAGLQRTESLIVWGDHALTRLNRGRAVPTLWGLSAGIVLAVTAGLLLNIKPLALLGMLLALFSVFLLGLAAGVTAVSLGRILAPALGRIEADDQEALRLGLTTLFFAACFPVIGWVVVLLLLASGFGAVIEAWVTRHRN